MNKKRITLLLVVALAFSAFPITLLTFVAAEPAFVLPNYEPMDVGPEFRSKDLPIKNIDAEGGLAMASLEDPEDTKEWMYLNDYTGYYYLDNFSLVVSSANTEIWLQVDYGWLPGDPRDDPVITQDMLDYLLVEFDDTIYPTDTGYFGTEDFHNGIYSLLVAWGYEPPGYYDSPEGKQVILLSNVRDDNYYDPTYPSYIAGFYSPSFEGYFDRNIINIDVYDWIHRVGNEENEWWDPEAPEGKNRPNLYESIIAHEYQHLIHDDWLGGDETWTNEACSLFAEPLCNYPIDWGQVEWFLATPDNSLTEWGDQGGMNILADYGAAFLWSMYVADHYGSDFWSRYVKGDTTIPDLKFSAIPRITGLLPEGIDFNDVFHDWRIANLIHSDKPGHGKYNYKSFDLGDVYPMTIHDMPGTDIDWTSAVEEFGYTITHPSRFYPGGITLDPEFAPPDGVTTVGPYSTEYIRFPDLRGIDTFDFDGADLADYPYEWQRYYFDEDPIFDPILDGSWWSGPLGDLKNVLLAGEVSVLAGEIDSTLDLLTYWDIEDDYWNTGSFAGWDFGFVQVSTDGGETWTSLENMYTSNDAVDGAHYGIVDNLPGLTGWTAYYPPYQWYTPIPMSFDLSAYVGQDIQLGFRFMTDWLTEYDGWFIKEAQVSGISIMDDLAPIPKEADFMVSIVEAKITPSGKVQCKQVIEMEIIDATELGMALALIRSEAKDAILIVSYVGQFGTVDYEFKAKSYRWRGRRGR